MMIRHLKRNMHASNIAITNNKGIVINPFSYFLQKIARIWAASVFFSEIHDGVTYVLLWFICDSISYCFVIWCGIFKINHFHSFSRVRHNLLWIVKTCYIFHVNRFRMYPAFYLKSEWVVFIMVSWHHLSNCTAQWIYKSIL